MFKFSSNSWHFKLANVGTERVYDWVETDICTYIRKVLAGFFVLCLFTMLGIIACLFIGLGVYENVRWVMGWGDIGPAALLLDGATLLIGSMLVIDLMKHKIRAKVYERLYNKMVLKKQQPDNFLVAVYKKFKEKTCYKVTFDENRDR